MPDRDFHNNFMCLLIASQLLTHHCLDLAAWLNSNMLSRNMNKVDLFFLSSCLHNKQNNIWFLGFMEFVFFCSTWFLTHLLCSLVSYWDEHWKRNFIPPQDHLYHSLFIHTGTKLPPTVILSKQAPGHYSILCSHFFLTKELLFNDSTASLLKW